MSMCIEVGYATPHKQMLIELFVAKGVTAQDVIVQSGILSHFLDIDLTLHKIGIFGKIVSSSHVLSDRDRVEIYRPLMADPKQARKIRAKRAKKSVI